MTSAPLNITIGLFGSGYVGKTSIARTFVKGYMDYEPSPDHDDLSKMISVNGQDVVIDIIDESRYMREYKEMRYGFYQSSDVFIFVYSVIDPDSLEAIEELYEDACCTIYKEHLHAIIAGNKFDLRNEDSVPFERAQKLANKYNCKVLETSALTSFNIDELFTTLLTDVLSSKEFNSHQANHNNGDGCCLIL